MTVPIAKSVGAHDLSAQPTGASRTIMQIDLEAGDDRVTQISEDLSGNHRSRARPKSGSFRLRESFEVRFNAAGGLRPDKRLQFGR